MSQFLHALGGVGIDSSVSGAHVVGLALIDIAIKSFLLLTVTWGATSLLRKRSAATGHRVWTLGFFSCLLVPVISLVAPTWNLRILPTAAPSLDESVTESQLVSLGTERTSQTVAENAGAPGLAKRSDSYVRGKTAARPIGGGEAKVVPSESDLAAGLLLPLTDVSAQAETFAVWSWILACSTFWIGGVLVCLLRTVWHRLSLARILGRCKSMDGEGWTTAAAQASRSLGFNRTVRLLKLEDALSPMIAGIFRPVVVLPGDADNWLPAKRRSILLHELAHAKRYDVLSQAAAGLVCALHWFNPLCWYGLSQMRKLRELACDDLVVASGQQPADYADVLLDVARTYRHRHPLMAVGMARGANVENRILAILDRARSHIAVSRRAARIFLALAAALAVLIGSMRLESQAEQPAVSPASGGETSVEEGSEQEKVEADNILRTIEVHITDEDGKPIEGAKLYIGVWYTEGYEGEKAPKEYFTNSDGIVNLKLPRRLQILRMWPSKPGYVPEFVNFGGGTHDEGKLIPDRYDFQLEQGTELSGTVVDESGQPISGVKVSVRAKVDEPAWRVNPKPMISPGLTDEDFFEGPVYTGKDGKWRINNAPAPPGEDDKKDYEFRLQVTHPEFAGDTRWGELQQQQGITTEDLRSGDAKLTLNRGLVISGKVIGPEGQPITKGWVVWNDEPYFMRGTWETGIDEEGHFRTPPLAAGEYPITVIAPGYAAERRMVTAKAGMEALRFKLKPGNRIVIRFVDADGASVPSARVSLGASSGANTWNNTNALHNQGGSNVPEYGVPRKANDQGVYVWDWAPDGAVSYQVGAKGFASQTLSLVFKSEPHVITLAPQREVAGTVTDASTGEPIKRFLTMPVIVFRPDFYHTRTTDAKVGQDGRYELPLTGSADPIDRYRVRFEADGYRSAVSEESFGPLDGRATLDFSLQPAPARKGRVVDADGRPAENATVLQASPTEVPNTSNGKPDSWDTRPIPTDVNGNFQLRATTEPVRVRAYHDLGFAEKTLTSDEEEVGVMKLKPWARISGRLLQEGHPVPDQSIYFSPLAKHGLTEARFQDSYHSQTDAEGRFEFERLPPIAGGVRASLGPWRDSPLTSGAAVPVDLKPGEHRTLTLGGDGIAVIGKVIAIGRGDVELNKNWSLNYLISRDRGIELPAGFPELSFDPTGPVRASWFLEPNHYEWLATRENYFVKLQPDGQLHVSGVPPGIYDLVLRLYEQPAGCLVETIGEKVVTIEITESDAARGTKDIGTIEVECRAGPRVGENMQLYTFTDTNGRQRSIQDMEGRHVLMHVWASWCAPCIEHMPDIRATSKRMSDLPVTFVGLNIDKDVSQAKALAERGDWNWSQNYLGDDSDVARQLAISSVPTYYLVGPDGLLVASSTEWSEMEERLAGLLQGKQIARE